MAILLGAFLMHGLTPGPEMLNKHLDVTYLIIWSLTLAHVIGAVICLFGSRWLAQVSRVRPEILLPVVLGLVFVAAFEGSHDWGDLYSVMVFGVIGWIMKRCGWPRPPLILGLVIGGIFERYLYISTELYGWGWLVRIPVMAIIGCAVWALYRPVSQIVKGLFHEFKDIRHHTMRLGPSAIFTIFVIIVLVAAIVSSRNWPQAAKIVPITAAYMALTAAILNLINEVFGPERARGNVDGGVITGAGPAEDIDPIDLPLQEIRVKAVGFFLWLAFLLVLVALIGFIPAIFCYVLVYMWRGFGEPIAPSFLYAEATAFFCWFVFNWALAVPWPQSLLGDMFPEWRAYTGFI